MFSALLLFFSKSLKNRVNKQLLALHSDLFSPLHRQWRSRIHRQLNSKWTCLTIPLIVLGVLIVSAHWRPAILSFVTVSDEFKNLFDQRLANAVTFLSGCLAVLAWFYSNLGIREPHAFRLVFRHAYLNTIFFYMVSLIVSMIGISAFRQKFEPNTFNQLILTVHYLFAAAFILLAFVFVQFKKVIDSKHIITLYGREFLEDDRNAQYQKQLTDTSRAIYSTELNTINFQQTGFHFGPNPAASHNGIPLFSGAAGREFVIRDINIPLLKFVFKPFTHEVNYFDALAIGDIVTSKYDPWLLYPDAELSRWRRWLLRQSIVLRRNRSDRISEETVQSILEKKLADYVDDDDTEHIDHIMKIFNQAYFRV